MKKAFLVLITIALVVGLSLSGIIPVAAQEPPDEGKVYTEVTLPLSTETVADVHTIPRGSVIYHFDDGTTEIYGPNNEFILAARDSEAALIPAPGGPARATYVYQIPNGSRIDTEGDTTYVYEGETCILTVVNQSEASITKGSRTLPPPPPNYTGWIECSRDESVAAIDWFRAYWAVPSSPPQHGSTTVDYLFNGIVKSTVIIQPVLEYNFHYDGEWTGAAWYVWDGWYRSAEVSVSTGNTIRGTTSWGTTYAGYWDIEFKNTSTGISTHCHTNKISTDLNLKIYCALEGVRVYKDGDVPGDTTFYSMTFKHDGSTVDITWDDYVWPEAEEILTGLGVVIYSDIKVKLETAN